VIKPRPKAPAFAVFEKQSAADDHLVSPRGYPVAMGIVIDNSALHAGEKRDKKVNKAALNLVRSSNPQDQVSSSISTTSITLTSRSPATSINCARRWRRSKLAAVRPLRRRSLASADYMKKKRQTTKKVLFVVTRRPKTNASRESLEEAISPFAGGKRAHSLRRRVCLGEEKARRARPCTLKPLPSEPEESRFFPHSRRGRSDQQQRSSRHTQPIHHRL